jgi:hypothetical protein
VADGALSLADRVAKQREQIKKRLGGRGARPRGVLRHELLHSVPVGCRCMGRRQGARRQGGLTCARCPLRAGLGKGLDGVLNADEFLDDADLAADLQPGGGTPTKARRCRGGSQGAAAAPQADTPEKQAASELLARADSVSARERNKLKRKAKALERQGSLRAAADARGTRVGVTRVFACACVAAATHRLAGSVWCATVAVSLSACDLRRSLVCWRSSCQRRWPTAGTSAQPPVQAAGLQRQRVAQQACLRSRQLSKTRRRCGWRAAKQLCACMRRC